MTSGKYVEELAPGDLIDLEGVDFSAANRQIWPFEFARVESVSRDGYLSGGWADFMVTPATSVIYLENGAVPALVPAGEFITFAP